MFIQLFEKVNCCSQKHSAVSTIARSRAQRCRRRRRDQTQRFLWHSARRRKLSNCSYLQHICHSLQQPFIPSRNCLKKTDWLYIYSITLHGCKVHRKYKQYKKHLLIVNVLLLSRYCTRTDVTGNKNVSDCKCIKHIFTFYFWDIAYDWRQEIKTIIKSLIKCILYLEFTESWFFYKITTRVWRSLTQTHEMCDQSEHSSGASLPMFGKFVMDDKHLIT